MPYDNLQQASKALASAIRTKAEALTLSPTAETADLLEGAALVKSSQQVESMVSMVSATLLDGSSADWVRPADWLTMPTLTQADNTFAGLFSVFPLGGNFVALKANGAYTVDWGDGIVQNFASDALAEHAYDFSAFDAINATLTTAGYKQALIKVTPQAGQTLTDINLGIKHTKITALTTPCVGFLDMAVYSNTLVNLFLEHPSAGSARTIRLGLLESLVISCAGLGSISYFLYSNKSLRNLVIEQTAATNMSYAFQLCSALQNLYLDVTCPNLYNTFSACTALNQVSRLNINGSCDATYCFQGCTSLKSVPDLVFNGSTINASYMFNSTGLIETPNIAVMGSINANYMFNTCKNLVKTKALDFSACTSYVSMFSGCESLVEVAPINLKAAGVSDMFSACTSLKQPPQITVNSAMSLSGLFRSSGLVRSVHSEWLTCTATISSMNGIYASCPSLVELVIDNLYGATDIGQLTSSTPVNKVLLPNLSGITVAYSGTLTTNSGCLKQVAVPGIKDSFSVSNQMLSAAALNAIFNDLATVTGKTITVTGNYGITESGYNPTIATAKGWTVTA